MIKGPHCLISCATSITFTKYS